MTILKYKQRKDKEMDEKDNMKKSIEKHCLECWDDDKEKVINCLLIRVVLCGNIG